MEGMRRSAGIGGEIFYTPNLPQFSQILAFGVGNYEVLFWGGLSCIQAFWVGSWGIFLGMTDVCMLG